MPIRFRCVFCNQLMGISRRKAGTMVRCPVCASSVTVPAQAAEDRPAEVLSGRRKQSKVDPPPPIFERSDFDRVLHEPLRREPAEPAPGARPDFEFREAPADAHRDNGSPVADIPLPKLDARVGILLTPKRAMILSVAAVIALALAFALGYWLGASMHQ